MHKYQVRIYYEDTDAGGIVYHANYLRYAERARTEMLRDLGYIHSELLKERGIGFVVRKIDIDYQKPAVLDDVLTVHSKITRVGGASFDIQQTIKKNDEVICEINLVLVCMNVGNFSATRLPNEIKTLFEKQNQETRGETINV